MDLQPLIIGFVLGTLGSFIGSWFSHFFNTRIARRNEFNQAAKEFIAAFQNELSRLKIETTSTYDIITPALPRHIGAYYIFRRYLSGRRLKKFIASWKAYFYSTPPCPETAKIDEEDRDTSEKEDKERIALIDKMAALLDFAKFK